MTIAIAADGRDLPRTETKPGRDSIRPALPFLGGAALWVAAILAFGYPAIIVPATLAVMVMFVVLITLTTGR